jgi:hypothetical protein
MKRSGTLFYRTRNPGILQVIGHKVEDEIIDAEQWHSLLGVPFFLVSSKVRVPFV